MFDSGILGRCRYLKSQNKSNKNNFGNLSQKKKSCAVSTRLFSEFWGEIFYKNDETIPLRIIV